MNLYAINQIVSLVDVTDSKISIHQDLIVPIMVTLAHEEEYTAEEFDFMLTGILEGLLKADYNGDNMKVPSMWEEVLTIDTKNIKESIQEYIDNELKDENVTNIKEYIETYGKNMLVFFYLDDLLLELNKRGFKPLITSASHVKINIPLNHKEYFKLHDMEIERG